VNPDLLGLALRLPFAPRILEIAYQFLLFRVHGDHRLTLFQITLCLAVDVFKLLIPVRMLTPFQLFSGWPANCKSIS